MREKVEPSRKVLHKNNNIAFEVGVKDAYVFKRRG